MNTAHSKMSLMRALVQSLLAGLGLLAVSGMRLALASPPPLQLLPMTQGLQDQLVLNRAPAAPVDTRVVLLPAAVPTRAASSPAEAPVAAAATMIAGLDPRALLQALSTASTQPEAVSAVALTDNAPTLALRPQLIAGSSAARQPAAAAVAETAAMTAPLAEAASVPIALRLATHHSLLLESPNPLTRVAIADDSIAQAIVISPYQVLLQGRQPGEVSLVMWGAGAGPRAYTVDVTLDPTPLQNELRRLFPNRALTVTESGNALTVSGTLANAGQAKQVLAVASGFSPKIVDDLSVDPVADPGQVLLQVRFAEVDRSAISQLGANLLSTATGLAGAVGTGQFGAPTTATVPPAQSVPQNSVTGPGGTFGLSDLLNVFLFNRNANLALLIKALQQKNLLQILAEPNLLAMDGKQASFLAGGEFPFPVVQGTGGYNNVTIQFKPFGVNLTFTPKILADGTIDLKVAPEVSSLDYTNALTVSGFLIPALSTRKAQTELELANGQSFVIAGLMDNSLTNTLSKIPGLSNIPVLGKFFESRSTNKSLNELVVVVTAHLVKPSATAPAIPAMPQPFLLPGQFDGKRTGAK